MSYSIITGITHNTLMNIPIVTRITKGSTITPTCFNFFHAYVNIQVDMLTIPDYFTANIIIEEEGPLSAPNIIKSLDFNPCVESESHITMKDVTIAGGWYRRSYCVYIQLQGLDDRRLLKRFSLTTSGSIALSSSSYMISLNNALSTSNIQIWKNALKRHVNGGLDRSAIHTLMVLYIMNYNVDIQHILMIIMEIIGKKITKEVMLINIKKIVDYKYNSSNLLYDIIYELDDYINSNNFDYNKFNNLLRCIKDLRV